MMTKDDYRAALVVLDLSQVAAAKFFRVNERTSRRWASGDQDVAPITERQIRMMLYYAMTTLDVDTLMTVPFAALLDRAALGAMHEGDHPDK
jgi:hypothetical protein